MQEEPHARTIRIGAYELDLRSGELSREDRTILLQEQPFQILQLLAKSPGDLVSREEIRQRLWPSGTIVEFENATNAAIKKLRIALSDSVEEPHYIETVKRRGYRLIAPVQPLDSDRQEPALPDVPMPVAREHAEGQSRTGERWGAARYWIFAAVAGVSLASLAAAYAVRQAPHRIRRLTDKDKLVLAEFLNKTGDPVFDETLRQGLSVQLDESPFLSLVSEERIQQELGLMAQPASARLTWELARQVCDRTSSAAVVEGSIANLGTHYVLWLRARDCRTGDTLDEEQMQAAQKESVLNALSQMASRFRTRVGESLATVEKHSTPLEEATTSSLEALQAYSAGRKAHAATGGTNPLLFFKRAVEIDPNFATAYVYLGHVYGEIGESDLAAENTAHAYRLKDRTSDPEKFLIMASYELRVTGDMEKLRQLSESWAVTYPREKNALLMLGGHVDQARGDYAAAVDALRKTVALDPDFAIGYDTLAFSYENLNQLDDAERALQRAAERKLELPDFSERRYNIAFLRGDHGAMEREVASSRGRPWEELVADQESLALAYMGRTEDSRRRVRHAVEIAEHADHRESAALYQAGAALREGLFGNALPARQSAAAALLLSHDREVEYGAAFSLALAGDSARASALADDLERRFGQDTSVRFSYLPVLRARIALNRGNPAQAIAALQAGASYDLGQPYSRYHGYFGSLYPVYVRGQAYLAAHQGSLAAAEFQKILDHPGIVVSDSIGALARLQRGRALAMSGDRRGARSAYRDFLQLWRDADPETPVLRKARAEYAALG